MAVKSATIGRHLGLARDGRDVLREAGLADVEIDALLADGVIG